MMEKGYIGTLNAIIWGVDLANNLDIGDPCDY